VAARGDPRVVAERYELRGLIGSGGASRVYAANDRVTGATVAVKLIAGAPAKVEGRVHREISALRLLRLPGVVSLRDDGVDDGERFLVMDLVPGAPFPGAKSPASWDEIAPLVLSLLEILARVHSAGVVHRDLKPANVLVDAERRVTVLDFGISWGPALGAAVTTSGAIVGTPEYLAPEQFMGAPGDARTDLYALGVMLYAALTGRRPHEASEFSELVRLKRSEMPAPLRILSPSVPREVAVAVDRLLAMDPLDRPQSAGEALQLLFERSPRPDATWTLPRLGPLEPLETLVADAAAGKSVDVAGPRGSGRSRLLSDAADRLVALGRKVHWLVPASAPYASVAGLVGNLDDLQNAGRDEAESTIVERVKARLAEGVVVVADDAERLDRWSADVVERCRGSGAVLRATNAPTDRCIRIVELSEEDLRPLFAGPDRIFHLREDGAHELWRRTGGTPARVATEMAAWSRAAFAHWDGARFVVRRDTLHRMREGQHIGDELLLGPGRSTGSPHLDELLAWIVLAWPHASPDVISKATGQPRWSLDPAIDALADENLIRRHVDGGVEPLAAPRALQAWPAERRRAAHQALAEILAPGTPQRLRHLAAAGASKEFVDEALLLAPHLTREGRSGDALVVLEEALASTRRADDGAREKRVLAEFAKTCLAGGTPHEIDRALYEFSRATVREAPIPQIERLLHGARAAGAGDPEQALRLLAEVDAFDDVDLELWRHGLRVRAALRLPLDRSAVVVAEAEAWANGTGNPRFLASVASWRALQLMSEGREEEAARMHLAASDRTDRVPARMASQYNAGSAFVLGGRLDEARAAAEKCREIAASCRNARYEALAEQLLRSVAYSLAETMSLDPELVEAVEALGEQSLLAQLLLTEAAVAWRAGLPTQAREFAMRSWKLNRRLGDHLLPTMARALEIVCGAPAEPGEIDRLVGAAKSFASVSADPHSAVQALGLLALAAPARARELRALAAEFAACMPTPAAPGRGYVLSVQEALEGLESQRGGMDG
jgi:serine/threonine-protein kinase